jgi:hypothetical protein
VARPCSAGLERRPPCRHVPFVSPGPSNPASAAES